MPNDCQPTAPRPPLAGSAVSLSLVPLICLGLTTLKEGSGGGGALATGLGGAEEPNWAWTPGTHLPQNPLWRHLPWSGSCPEPLRHKPMGEAAGSAEAKSCTLTKFAFHTSMPQPCPWQGSQPSLTRWPGGPVLPPLAPAQPPFRLRLCLKKGQGRAAEGTKAPRSSVSGNPSVYQPGSWGFLGGEVLGGEDLGRAITSPLPSILPASCGHFSLSVSFPLAWGHPGRLSPASPLPLVLGIAIWADFSLLCLIHTSFPLTLGLLAEPSESQSRRDTRGLSLK